jgi:hypothetical protein
MRKVEALLIASRGILPINGVDGACIKHSNNIFQHPAYSPGHWGSWYADCQWDSEDICAYKAMDVSGRKHLKSDIPTYLQMFFRFCPNNGLP